MYKYLIQRGWRWEGGREGVSVGVTESIQVW